MESRIIIEDEHLVAVRKPAGQLVVADRFGKEQNILLHQLGEYLRARGHKPDPSGRDLYPVHRLDRDTTGIVLFAKNQEAHRRLSMMFEKREMAKVYWALACGVPEWDDAWCGIPLSRAEGKSGRGRALIDLHKGKEASTWFHRREQLGNVCWIEARPETGRLHQIRLHLKALGHPVLFDEAYWDKSWKCEILSSVPPQSMALHARALVFRHPFSGEQLKLECPMEASMRSLLQSLQSAVRGQ